eukprot:scaffold17249_cov126-Isochrysis_galbana.AAC.8
MRWLADSYSRCGADSAPRHNHTPTAQPGAGDRGTDSNQLGPPLPLVKGNPHCPIPRLGPPPYPHPGTM